MLRSFKFTSPSIALAITVALLPIIPIGLKANAQDLLPDNIQFSGATINIKKYAQFPSFSSKLISMTSQPGSDALYVSSQEGRIYRVTQNSDGTGNYQEWFNIASKVDFNGRQTSAHGGLRNTTFHPDFAKPGSLGYGKFYTSQMIRSDNNAHFIGSSQRGNGIAHDSTVSEWTYDFDNSQVNSSSYRELFRIKMPVFDHPVKQMTFNQYAKPGDEDYGLLYIAHGDASNQSATFGGGENLDDGLGKIFRINPLQSDNKRYTTPGNPFVNVSGALDEIYAYGFRNPHHISFNQDASGKAHLVTADVGRDSVDEINVVESGKNYGWSTREGTFLHRQGAGGYITSVGPLPSDEATNGLTYPTVQLDHNTNQGDKFIGFAVAGGFTIDIDDDPDTEGQYIFGNFGRSGDIFHVSLEDMLNQVTELSTDDPNRNNPDDLTWLYPELLKIKYDHDNNPNTAAKNFDNFVDLIRSDGSGSNRADFRFGRGPNGEMFISSKQSRTVYIVTNAIASVPEPGTLAIAAIGMFRLTRRRRT